MSRFQKEKVVRVLDPTVNFYDSPKFALMSGVAKCGWREVDSSSLSNSSAFFTNIPSSPLDVLQPEIYLKMDVTVSMTGTTTGSVLLNTGYDAFRAYPLANATETIDLSINSKSVTSNPRKTSRHIMQYHQDCKKLAQRELSLSPSCPDQAQEYDMLTETIRNPLCGYADSIPQGLTGRGAFPYESFATDATTGTVRAVLVEPLFVSPLAYGGNYEMPGFTNLNAVSVRLTFTDISRMWSHASGISTLSSVSVVFNSASLLVRYKSPDMYVDRPPVLYYPYTDLALYESDSVASLSAGSSTELLAQTISPGVIPSMLYVYCQQRDSDRDYTASDAYLSITKLEVRFMNETLFTSATHQQLYDIARSNGLRQSWAQFSGDTQYNQVGSDLTEITGPCAPLALRFGKDVGMPSSHSVSQTGTYSLSVRVTVKNVGTQAVIPTVGMILSTDGVFTIENNTSSHSLGISPEEAKSAKVMEDLLPSELEHYVGGSFFSTLGRWFKRGTKAVVKHGPALIELAKKVSEMLGAGMVGGKLVQPGRAVGGRMVGGEELMMDEYEPRFPGL